MNKITTFVLLLFLFIGLTSEDGGCHSQPANTSALDEQAHTERNQRDLNKVQPAPSVSWSMERDNLIKLKKLQNDRTVNFYMYIFIEGIADPIGYYQVNKVSSVNSQLTNPEQLLEQWNGQHYISGVVSSPSEDGSYGTNGDAVFGFTPEDIMIETNMKFITATVPLNFTRPINRLAIINSDEARSMLANSKKAMNK